jgi:hypothetical protein
MQFFSIKRAVVILGAVAALAVGTGALPTMTGSVATAQAAELAQPDAQHHGSFRGQRFFARHGFSHRYWGWGYHRYYPAYYVTYVYEPVSVCDTYYFDDGVWYCFTGY